MNIQTLVLCVNRMYNNYNPETNQKIRDDKIKFLAEELRKYNDNQMIKAVSLIIEDENIKRFPSIAQIRNYIPRGDSNTTHNFCDRCERTGYYNVWQYRESLGKWYSIAYRCSCNSTTMQQINQLDIEMIPNRAHNIHPPNDAGHNDFNAQKSDWNYERLDAETFKALAYSHKMKNALERV